MDLMGLSSSQIGGAVDGIIDEIVTLRHELHQHPEIRFEEHWTAKRIGRFLEQAHIPYSDGFAGGTGIVATLAGAGPKTVALRADMDGLELEEQTGVQYASQVPHRMHACGHDGHVACLCGAAKVLGGHRDQLGGTVKLIFQPAEELGAGGRRMVEEGVLDDVDGAFALHAWPDLPVGRIGLKSGAVMASADWFRIEVAGKGCHAADPASGVDPVVVAAHITTALQTIVSREVAPRDAAVVTVGRIQAGVATNIIPDTARLEGTFRTLSSAVRDVIAAAVERVAKATAAAFRAEATVEIGRDSYAPLVNHPAMTDFARRTVDEVLGPDAVVDIEQPSMASEDFAFYLQKVPGAYLRLGIGDDGNGKRPPLHSALFDFNDKALGVGIRVLAGLGLRFFD